MNLKESRREDMWKWILTVSEEEDIIKLSTIPPVATLTFSMSGWQSENTYKALKDLFYSIRKDNLKHTQTNNINKKSCQSRTEDWWEWNLWYRWQLIISNNDDMKITITSLEEINFKNPNVWWASKHTYETAKQLILAIKKDNKENIWQ